jgi:hypothetical protein
MGRAMGFVGRQKHHVCARASQLGEASGLAMPQYQVFWTRRQTLFYVSIIELLFNRMPALALARAQEELRLSQAHTRHMLQRRGRHFGREVAHDCAFGGAV